MLSRALNGQGVTLVAGVTPLLRLLAEATTSRPEAASATSPRACRWTRGRLSSSGRSSSAGWARSTTTETGPICVRPPVPWQDAQSLGEPLKGVQVDLRPLEPGHDAADSLSGLVAVRSLTAMIGYLYPDQVDPEPVADGFLTGDIGRMTPDGLVIVGRLANCVNVGGTKVSPEEVEAVLLEFPAVRSCLVDGEPDEWRGQRIRATVTPADVDLTALRAFCRDDSPGRSSRAGSSASTPSKPPRPAR